MTSSTFPDVIDQLLGIAPGDPLDRIRARRPQARAQAQRSHEALFDPAPPVFGQVSPAERHALAAFVALLHGETAGADALARLHLENLRRQPGGEALIQALRDEAARGAAQGPYGRYPAGPLSAEDRDGPAYAVSEARRATLGPRLAAALAHAHLLVHHPRDASPAALKALLDAGWSSTDIVILSQLVAFLSFQIRVVAGLRALAPHLGAAPQP